jgi:hypothetical protein
MTIVIMCERRFAKCPNTECHYDMCRYAESRGALKSNREKLLKLTNIFVILSEDIQNETSRDCSYFGVGT